MGVIKNLIIYTVISVSILLAYKAVNIWTTSPSLPKLDENFWWGPGKPIHLGVSVLPFMVEVNKVDIIDLNQRLDKYIKQVATNPLEEQGFQYGFNTDYLRTVIQYWRNEYDWAARQNYVNRFPHYKTYINGLHMHFIRVTPKPTAGKKILPLLLLHGWPGSVLEFYDAIPKLTSPRADEDFVFEVIVPSLPGYGFSQGAAKPGLGTTQIAVIMKNLMSRLGFEKFYVQGGDWGSVISRQLAILYPNNVLGVHSNFCESNRLISRLKLFLGAWFPSLVVDKNLEHKMYPITNKLFFILEEMGYAHIQATKPDTIGTVLRDSPAGLAAYILEKFSTWTNPAWKTHEDGGLTKKFSLEKLLDNVMIYWITGSITTSQRLYAEFFRGVDSEMESSFPVTVPAACARFQNELLWQSESLLRDKYVNLVQISDFSDGGHFAAFEEPDLFSEDVWLAVKKFEVYHKKSGIKNEL